jgi:hypothetical protein
VLYRALSSHTSAGTFDLTYWTPLYRDADRSNGQKGMYAGPADIATVSTAALVSGRAYLVRLCPSRDMTIGSIAFAVATASGTNDPVDVGIYDAGLVRLVSSGAVTGKLNSTGPKTVPVASTALTAGAVYYVALSAASTATVGTLSMANSNMVQLFGAGVPTVEMDRSSTDTIHPLTASITSSGGTSVCPLLAIIEA